MRDLQAVSCRLSVSLIIFDSLRAFAWPVINSRTICMECQEAYVYVFDVTA